MSLTHLQIEQLFGEHRQALTRRLFRLVRSKELAADLAQETFLRLVALAGKQVVSYPRALLFRTATNLAIDYLRKKRIESLHISEFVPLEVAAQIASPGATPERELWGKQQLQCVYEAIEALPMRTREAFLLHRLHGYSYQEIAAHLGISESAVDKRMNRALKQCWAALQG